MVLELKDVVKKPATERLRLKVISAPSSPASDDLNPWNVYLVSCVDGTYYCGVAKCIGRRLEQHNGQKPGGARYTRTRRPVKLLAFCICTDKRSAYKLEYAVKAAPRGKKLDIIVSAGGKLAGEV